MAKPICSCGSELLILSICEVSFVAACPSCKRLVPIKGMSQEAIGIIQAEVKKRFANDIQTPSGVNPDKS